MRGRHKHGTVYIWEMWWLNFWRLLRDTSLGSGFPYSWSCFYTWSGAWHRDTWALASLLGSHRLQICQEWARIAGCSTAPVQDLWIQIQHEKCFPGWCARPSAHSETPQRYTSSIWSVNMVYQAQGRPEHRFPTSQVISLITRIDK